MALVLVDRLITFLGSVKKPTITKGLVILLCLSVASLIYLAYYVSDVPGSRIPRNPPEPTVQCRFDASTSTQFPNPPRDHSSKASLRIHNKALVMVETQYSRHGQELIAILEANRIRYKVELAGKGLPYLTHMDKGKYGVIIFENFMSYVHLDKWNRQLLDKYCREYNVGIIAFTFATDKPMVNAPIKGFPLCLHTNLALKDYDLNPASEILRIVRSGERVSTILCFPKCSIKSI